MHVKLLVVAHSGLFRRTCIIVFRTIPQTEPDYDHLDSPTDLGKVWGCIGKIRFFTGKCKK